MNLKEILKDQDLEALKEAIAGGEVISNLKFIDMIDEIEKPDFTFWEFVALHNNYYILKLMHLDESFSDIVYDKMFNLSLNQTMHFTEKDLKQIISDYFVKHITLFMLLASFGTIKSIKLFLLDNKIDINEKNDFGWTALIFTICTQNTENVELLIEEGVDITTNYRAIKKRYPSAEEPDVYIEEEKEFSPLFLALKKESIKIVKLFLK